MKTIKNLETGELKRVEDKESYQRVGYGWTYVPKSEWKEYRKTNVVVVEEEPQPKQTKASKKNEKKNRKRN